MTNLELRDIHLPESSLWWPPAPGWWIGLLLLIMLIILLPRIWRKLTTKSLKSNAESALNDIEQDYRSHQNQQQLATQISQWLRCVVMSYCSRDQAASLTGDEWLETLNGLGGKAGSEQIFDQKIGKVLSQSLYQQNNQIDGAHLLKLCQRWLNQLPKNNSGKIHLQKNRGSHAAV